jgi:hypothetical protein
MPQLLIDFYMELIHQMYLDDDFQEIISNILQDVKPNDCSQRKILDTTKDENKMSVKKEKSSFTMKKINNIQQIEKTDSLIMLSNLPNVETLLHGNVHIIINILLLKIILFQFVNYVYSSEFRIIVVV